MRIWFGILALAVLTAGVVLYVLARRPPAVAVAPVHDAALPRLADAAPSVPDAAVVVVIDAAAAPRAAELDALRSSGQASEVWVPQASELLRGLDRGADVECYVAGCGAMLTFPSEDAYQRAIETVAADRTWTGGKKWTAAVRAPGRVTVALLLYRPD